MSEERTITIKKQDLWKYSTFLLIAIVVIGGFFVFTGNNFPANTGNNVVAQQPDTQPSIVKASVDDDPALGNENAPITIIEFSDYQCPFCRKFWTETLPSIQKEYIDTGKVKFVYRDFPLISLHPMATPAAEAAECVRDSGGDEAYFKMHDKIFQEQNVLDGGDANSGPVKSTVTFTNNDLKSWAKDIGYNIDSCLDSGKFKSEVQKDLNDATNSGGQGTPYFIIMKSGDKEGIPLSGAYPFSTFQQILDGI
ncbi:DsbA family protein [Candidatus Pacearchaeota archaeon]|nr:DsbA family protein [Candidatus Pacearchaeota archaeon]